MKNIPSQIAIIGPTASGKSALAVQIAKGVNGVILSLDSLSIYKGIDIASAKPTMLERDGIEHFGIDILKPNEPFDVTLFIELYKKVYSEALSKQMPLIIVGGSSFYLKMLLVGISSMPNISDNVKLETTNFLNDLSQAYEYLNSIDPVYMSKIKSNDRYRIEKALMLYLQTLTPPSKYFRTNPPISIITAPLPIYEIQIDRQILRERIAQRTINMINDGLIKEVEMLEAKYTRSPNPMKSIGIKETLEFLDGKLTKDELMTQISTHTAQLAKRQTTFNRSQFVDKKLLGIKEIYKEIMDSF
ncbi:MAG: tRNA (adenosine(37)-N6)-dimethylallyltransferase MiaA [Sulfurovaceae bacterium]|nr:tRNA (adenosine(37)-N6)-dimethylallyltransferase MiaA [Sulfurovaceae bacterium]